MKTQTIKKNNGTKTLTLNSILLSLGLLMHQLTPALGLPIQPDLALSMLFILIIINNKEYKTCILCGLATGILTALTTKFPGGQIPNILDKVITANIVFVLIYMIKNNKIIKSMGIKKQDLFIGLIVFPIGTLISGTIFLVAASIIVGLPASFKSLFLVSVLPAIIANTMVGLLLLKVLNIVTKIK